MPLYLNGSSGVSGVDGSNTTPAIQGTDTNTGMVFPAADTIAFVEGGTEVMRIDSSGRLGIGTASPAWKLHITDAAAPVIQLEETSVGNTIIGQDANNFFIRRGTAGAADAFTIDGSSNVGIGNTTPNAKLQVTGTANVSGAVAIGGVTTCASRIVVPAHTSSTGAATGVDLTAAGSGYLFGTTGDNATSTLANVKLASWFGIGFSPSISGQTVPQWENAAWIDVRSGAFSCRNNITAYSSDERLKTNFTKIINPLAKLVEINGYEFDWDVAKCKTLGFEPIQEHEHGVKAQEIQKVVPDAVSIAPFDDDGDKKSKSGENYLTVRYERLVPLLIEAIKEQQVQIAKLREEITSLKQG